MILTKPVNVAPSPLRALSNCSALKYTCPFANSVAAFSSSFTGSSGTVSLTVSFFCSAFFADSSVTAVSTFFVAAVDVLAVQLEQFGFDACGLDGLGELLLQHQCTSRQA